MTDKIRIHSETVEMVQVKDLAGYEKNARTHSSDQIGQLVAVIKDSGFTNPLLIDDKNVIIAGHGRLTAAKQLNMETVPCIRISGLTPQQVRALRLSDNKIAMNAGWDKDLLRVELGELKNEAFDLNLTAFSLADMNVFAPQGPVIEPNQDRNAKIAESRKDIQVKIAARDRARVADILLNGARELEKQGDAKSEKSVAGKQLRDAAVRMKKLSNTIRGSAPKPVKAKKRKKAKRARPLQQEGITA